MFNEQLFPRRVSANATGGPVFSTMEVMQPNGYRLTNPQRLMPLHEYEVGHAVRTAVEFEAVRAVFYASMGKANGFRFEDPADHIVTRATSSLTDLGGGDWQLNRIYQFGSVTFTRPIFKPLDGVVIYDAGGSVLTATVSTTTGIAEVSGTPATWAGSFHVPVAFADDAALFSIIGTPSMLVEWPSIKLVEIREVFA